MKKTQLAKQIISEFNNSKLLMRDIKKKAKEIKKDHELAMHLWSSEEYYPRLLAILILDKLQLTPELVYQLAEDIQAYEPTKRHQLSDWLLANQLMKSKKTINQILTWETSELILLQRLFWYYQARLRWMGKNPLGNTSELMESLEKNMHKAYEDVQWTMNFCAGQIGVHNEKYRSRCIQLGESLELYKDEKVPKNCTPSYLPEFIRIEVAKLN